MSFLEDEGLSALTLEQYDEARAGSARASFLSPSHRIGCHPDGGYIYLAQLTAFVDELIKEVEMWRNDAYERSER